MNITAITFLDLSKKSHLELIQQLVDNLILGDTSQTDLLRVFAQVSVWRVEELKSANIFKKLDQYCENGLPEAGLEKNEGQALFIRGFMHDVGILKPKNKDQAINFYRQAIAQGNIDALINYANTLDKSIEENYVEAQDLYSRAIKQSELVIEQGHLIAVTYAYARALIGRADMLMFQNPIPLADYQEAKALYELAIKQSNADAMFKLGLIYSTFCSLISDDGIPNQDRILDGRKTASLFEAAANKANMPAILERMDDDDDFAPFIDTTTQTFAFGLEKAMKNLPDMIGSDDEEGNQEYSHLYARMWRSTFEQADYQGCELQPEKLEAFQAKTDPYFVYHYLMFKLDYKDSNTIEPIITLMRDNPDLVEEFIEFECNFALNIPKNINRLEAVYEAYIANTPDNAQQEQFASSVLFAVRAWKQKYDRQDMFNLEVSCLSKLNIDNIKAEHLNIIFELVIDTWYASSGSFTDGAAAILSQLMAKLRLLDKDSLSSEYSDHFRNIAVILVAKLYGPDHYIPCEYPCPWTMKNINLLIALIECPMQLTAQELNDKLGKEMIAKKIGPAEKSIPTTAKSDSTISLRGYNGILFKPTSFAAELSNFSLKTFP